MRVGLAMRAIGLVAALLAAIAAQADGIMDLRNGDTVMFMGDSITVFGQARNGGYVRLVEKALQMEGVEIRKIVNAGCGYQSPTMVAHCMPRLTEERPDVMTFSCGVNDVLHTFCPPAPGRTGTGLEAYKRNVARIFDEADRLGTRVIVLTTTMLREDETNAMNREIAPYNDFLRAEASRRGYRLADVNKAHREQLRKVKKGDRDMGWLACYDGIHMAEAGNRMMAVEILKAMGVPAGDFPKIEAAWADMRDDPVRLDVKACKRPEPDAVVEARIDGLLSRMTLREKAGQLSQQPLYDAKTAEETREARRRGEIGSYILFGGPKLRNEVQRDQVEHSRLGIPLMFGSDVLHGESMAFPSPCSLACSFEPELFERCQAVAAREARAGGVDWVFAPMCDLARDIRWGRIVETCGEDPYLSALCNAAQVRGFQGPDNDVSDPARVAACLKHFVGYSSVVGGRDHCESTVSEWELRNFHLPSFRAGVAAGAKTVMSAFNTIDGRPAVMCRHTLTDVLRGEWGFNGFVVSDWGSVAGLVKWGVARDAAEASLFALSAGNDMDMCTGSYVDSVERLVSSGKLSVRTLDESVRKVLRVKFALGLFERPYCDADRYEALYTADRAREAALAREAGRKCAVLLKNEDGILPLAADRARKIALIGPFADDHDEMRGSWAANTMHTRLVTLREGLADGLPAGMSFEYAKGCDILDRPLTRIRTDAVEEKVGDGSKASGEEELAAAMAAAGRSDLVILAIGETRRWSGEGGSRCDLGLTGRQQELFDAAAASGKPVVAVIFSGRPLILPKVYDRAKAVLFAGQPGCEAGHAVADLLFGRFSPSGRLSVSIPRGIGWVPMNYNGATTGHPDGTMRYRDSGKAHGAAYPFGFGLSYATFAYSPVTLDAKADGTCEAVCRIRNTGAVAAIETPQLYVRSEACSEGWRPARELRGFRRVSLRPGESAEVRFPISNQTLGFVNRQGRDRTEAGTYKIWVAPDSASGKSADLEWNVR